MMGADSGRADVELAHVLFIDIAGYSLERPAQQAELVFLLQEVVRGTNEFRRASASGDLVSVPTGDGLVLVFFADPLAPARCAVEVARAALPHSGLRLRMGVHSGPVRRMTDINANVNVSGTGVNIAQRVMDCGSPGQILLSAAAAALIEQMGEWSLLDLGEQEVKHGLRLRLYSLCGEDFGTATDSAPVETSDRATLRMPGTQAGKTPLVCVLYRRHVEPDERLMWVLERAFRYRGYEVFLDRHLTVGVEWAKEIERRVRTSDVVIPLISQASLYSEMLTYEVEIAHEAALRQHGKPRILPVRVGYHGPLPEPLGAILDRLQYTCWEGEADDDRVLDELLTALEAHPAAPAVSVVPEPVDAAPRHARGSSEEVQTLEPVGGAVPIGSRFYVERESDAACLGSVRDRDSIILIKGARQIGKSSLLARALHQARELGYAVALTDFQRFNVSELQSPESFLLALAEALADDLDLDEMPEGSFTAHRGPNTNLERYIRRHVLAPLGRPLVWALDEVDRLFAYDYGSEVFGLFRSWHNARALSPSSPWAQLTLVISYATEAHLFITDVNQSPFNVGTRIVLRDLDATQVADLNERYGRPLRASDDLDRFLDLVGGHPYLTRRGLHEMVTGYLDMDAFEAAATAEDGCFGDHLRRILVLLMRDDGLAGDMRDILNGRTPSTDVFFRLRSAGLLTGEAPADARLRCRLYDAYLRKHLA